MAVQEQTPYIEYVANGVTTTFPITFDLDAQQSSVSVKIDDDITTGWSIIGNQVVFTQAPPVDSLVKITRTTMLKRETTYQTYNNSFRPEVFNKDFDRVWYALQEQNFKVGQYDYDYSYAVNKSNQAFQTAHNALQRADSAYSLADQTQPLNKGGTGATTAETARSNLNTYSKEEVDALVATGGAGNVVGIAGGGTGATTAETARSNLGVPSTTDVTTAIDNSKTPNATETVAGKAKIATTAIAQAGTNDTDFITPLKLKDSVFGLGQTRKTKTIISGTEYINTGVKPIVVGVVFNCTASSVQQMNSTLTINGILVDQATDYSPAQTYRQVLCAIILPSEKYVFQAVAFSAIASAWEIS